MKLTEASDRPAASGIEENYWLKRRAERQEHTRQRIVQAADALHDFFMALAGQELTGTRSNLMVDLVGPIKTQR